MKFENNSKKRNFVFGDTVLTGMLIYKEDGTSEFIEATPHIIVKTTKENNDKNEK